ncbi:MAG: GlxA family transcriptional regulator [Ilumatobacteraceae bacterium]
MDREHVVVVVAYDGFQLLDLAGPLEVLSGATRFGATPPYRSLIATPGGQPVTSTSGVSIRADVDLASLASGRRRIDTLVVVGGLGTRAAIGDRALLDSIAALGARATRVSSVCSGSLLLAAAGLLDGYAATTHWNSCEYLAHYDVEVRSDQIFVHDRDRWTSAGITTGIDLFLALVEHDHGTDLAHQLAQWLVVFVRRPGGQSQFSTQLRVAPATTPSIADLQRWLSDHLTDDLRVDALAERAHMSPRSFARKFHDETGTTPAAYVEQLRVEAARRLLETTDLTIATIAQHVGLHHPETLHRAFRRQLGTTPDSYRQHFARRAS